MDPSLVKDRITLVRIELEMSIPEFAKHTGVALRTLEYWEHTDREPQMSSVRRIANATGRSAAWFYGVDENGIAA